MGATLALITQTVCHIYCEVRTDTGAFGVASVSLNLTLADLQSGVVQACARLVATREGETTCRSLRP